MMTFVLPYQVIVPIHGIVQFISNSSRAFYLRKNVRWGFFGYFLLGVPFGLYVAYLILNKIDRPDFYYLILALFILYTIFKPKKMPHFKLEGYQWSLLGFFAAVQGSIVGASGPLIAPFYLRDDMSKEEIISTKAMQQLIIHLMKVPLFLSLDFSYKEYSLLIICMSLAALLGTFSGVSILKKFDEKLFKIIFKSVLFLSAMRLIYKFIQSYL